MLKLVLVLVVVLCLYGAAILLLPPILSHRRAKRHVESKRRPER